MFTPNYLLSRVLARLEKQFSEATVSAWFADTEVIGLLDNTLVIYAPSSAALQAIKGDAMPYILETLSSIMPYGIGFEVWDDAAFAAYKHRDAAQPFYCKPQFTFENFMIGESNRHAVITLKAAAEGTKTHTPIFLYGPKGSGKTHLLNAFANSILKNSRESHIIRVNADQFTAELIYRLRCGEMDKFYRTYDHADILLVDDVQFFADKKTVQEEFARIFSSMLQQNKQVFLTFDRNPKEISIFESCLKDCFDSGVFLGIAPPDYATTLAIVRLKAQTYNLALSGEALEYIATAYGENIPDADRILNRLRIFCKSGQPELTPTDIQHLLAEIPC